MKKRSILLLLILFQIAMTIGSCDSRHAAEKPDTTRPAVMATSPSNGATAIAVNATVTITFSKAMNPATINETTFVVTSTPTVTVAGTVKYDTASHVATFTSSTVLDHNVKHTATISASVSDAVGNTLGSSYSWTFTTIPAPGALDASFGTNGKVRMSLGPGKNDIAYALAIQQDGKIVAVGLSSLSSLPTSTQYFTITRFLTTGLADTAFGLYQTGRADYFIGSATSVALQSDGKIVAAGSNVVSMSSLTSPADFLIARYNTDGTRDTSLNSDGTVTMNTGGYVRSVVNSLALQSDNMIVVAGDCTNDASTYVSIVARFTTTGALDTAFNTTGVRTDTIGTTSRAAAIKIQPDDGKIVVGGNYQDGSGPQSFYLSRFATDGTPDVLFSSGTITASPGTGAVLADIAILPNGKILVAGTTNMTNSVTNSDVFIMQYNADGTLDTTFGTNGIMITDDGNNGVETATGLAVQTVQQDWKIVVAATFNPTTGSTQTKDFALFRYNADGTEDTTFGNGHGMVHTDFGYDDIAGDVQIQQDGKIVEVGCAWNGLTCDIGLARYWP